MIRGLHLEVGRGVKGPDKGVALHESLHGAQGFLFVPAGWCNTGLILQNTRETVTQEAEGGTSCPLHWMGAGHPV